MVVRLVVMVGVRDGHSQNSNSCHVIPKVQASSYSVVASMLFLQQINHIGASAKQMLNHTYETNQ